MKACRESKRCMTPCKCRYSTAHTKMRATSGYRNLSPLTLETSLTQSFWTLPIKSTRGINEHGWELTVSGASACFRCWPLKVKGWGSNAGRKWLLYWGMFLDGCIREYLLTPAQTNLLSVDTKLNMFITLDSETPSLDTNPFPAGECIGTYKQINNRTFLLEVFPRF